MGLFFEKEMASANRESRLFASYRALGLISSRVPATIQYVPNAKLHAIVCSVGNVIHTYRSRKLALWNVSSAMKAEINCLASNERYVFVGYGNIIKALHFGRHEKYTYAGHAGEIQHLLPFGSHLVSVDSQSEMKVWDIETEEIYNQTNFDINTFAVSAICHPATYLNKILLGSRQGGLKLFNLKTNKLIYEFKGWESGVTKLEQSPAVDVVAVGLNDGRIFVHNLKLDETLMSFKQDWGRVIGITFRTDGPPFMLTSSDLGHVAIWDLEKRKLCSQMASVHNGSVSTLVALQNEPLVVTSSEDNSLKIWIFDNADGSGRLLHCRDGHSKPPNFIRFHGSDGCFILSAGSEGTIKAFHTRKDHLHRNLGTAGLMRKQVAKKKRIAWENVSLPPCTYLSSGVARESTWDNVVCCHEGHSIATTWTSRRKHLGDHKLRHERFIKDHKFRNVRAVCCTVSTCGNFVLIGYSSGHVDVFNVQSGVYRGSFVDKSTSDQDRAHDYCVTGVCVDGLNYSVVTSCEGGLVKIWNFKNRSFVESIIVGSSAGHLEIHKDNGLLALVSDKVNLLVIDVEFRRVVRRFNGAHSSDVTDLTFNQSGHWILTASLDKTIKIWDLTSASLIDVISLLNPCLSLTFSPTGDYLATIHEGQFGIYLWASKYLYNPGISLKPLPFDYKSEETVDLPGTETVSGLDGESEDEEMDQSIQLYASPLQLSDDLITLSGMPTPRWAHLSELDVIKERNKPKEPPKKPKQAPFFLPTVSGLTPKFDVATSQTDENANQSNETRVLSFAKLKPKSDFAVKLENASTAKEYQSVFDVLRQYGPSGIEMELRNLNPLHGGSTTLMKNFLKLIDYVLETKTNFELANSYLGLFLKLHRDILWSTSGENQTFNEYSEELRSLKKNQLESWQKLDTLFTNSLCLTNYVKSAFL